MYNEMDFSQSSQEQNAILPLSAPAGRKQKNLVGSARSGILNYQRQTKAFQSDYVPPHARMAATTIKEFITPDILGIKTPEWNSSTYLNRMHKYEEQTTFDKKRFEIRAGLRDEQTLPPRPNKIYQGTQTRDNYRDWNVSVQIKPREVQKQLDQMNRKYKQRTASVNKQVLTNYIRPQESQNKFQNTIRNDKVIDEELRQKIRKEYEYANPEASQEKIAANIFKLVAQWKLKQRQAEVATQGENEETYKPNLTKTIRNRNTKVYYHDGSWELSSLAGREAWSCCMNEFQNSPGCCVKIKNPDKWQTLTM